MYLIAKYYYCGNLHKFFLKTKSNMSFFYLHEVKIRFSYLLDNIFFCET